MLYGVCKVLVDLFSFFVTLKVGQILPDLGYQFIQYGHSNLKRYEGVKRLSVKSSITNIFIIDHMEESTYLTWNLAKLYLLYLSIPYLVMGITRIEQGLCNKIGNLII